MRRLKVKKIEYRDDEHGIEIIVEADVVITTASIPGKQAPRLITADMVREMREGSVIVDLAIESGGNCELSEHDKVKRWRHCS